MSAPTAASLRVLVGLGNPDRGDDAVGPLVARHVGALPDAVTGGDLVVVERAAPVDLWDVWALAPTLVIVDAVLAAGSLPGTVAVLDVSAGGPPGWDATGWRGGGSHALSLPAAVELARTLGELPRRVVVIGVQGSVFGPGDRLSGPVEAALDRAVAAVLTVLGDPRPR